MRGVGALAQSCVTSMTKSKLSGAAAAVSRATVDRPCAAAAPGAATPDRAFRAG